MKSTILVLLLASIVGVHASSRSSQSATPISLKHGISKVFNKRYDTAKSLAALEQEVEDYNAQWIASSKDAAQAASRRRLICMPLEERLFDPPMGAFSHGHVQTGDKMSIPAVLMKGVNLNKAEVPWLWSVSRVEGVTQERVDVPDSLAKEHLHEVVGSVLDYRAPPNYIFLPWWMMRALGVQPRDIVDVKLTTTTPPGSLAKLRPHSSSFSNDIANPQAVLETELRHYSCLTKGSTIAFDYNGKRYWFDVEELRSAPRGEKQPIVKVMDCDLATDFLPAKDSIKKRKKRPQNDDEDE